MAVVLQVVSDGGASSGGAALVIVFQVDYRYCQWWCQVVTSENDGAAGGDDQYLSLAVVFQVVIWRG